MTFFMEKTQWVVPEKIHALSLHEEYKKHYCEYIPKWFDLLPP